MLVNKLDYLYRTLVVKSREQCNETVEITDDDYEKYYVTESEQDDPIPGSNIPIPGEDENEHDYSKDYLTFEAIEDGTFSFTVNSLYYSTNNGMSWKSLAACTETELIKAGTKVLWKKDSEMINDTTSNNSNVQRKGIGTFSSTSKFNISGNILSLALNNFNTQIVNKTFWWACAFRELFKDCVNLINAKNLILPIKDLSGYTSEYYGGGHYFSAIYCNMFENCSNLLYGPKILPAKVLSQSCYHSMFKGCTSLLESPILPAINLSNDSGSGGTRYCYYNMFEGCTSLQKITMLANINSSNLLLENWVKDVPTAGIFIKNIKSTFDNIGSSGIPAGWEVINEEVPEE